jgi:peptidoglycan hydrolase-like protein with peptidoglycan-binding domain
MPPPFQSAILRGNGPNARIEQAASKPPSIKKAPPADDPEAIKRIQRALVKLLGVPMPKSFPNGPDGEPDGKFGQETFDAVVTFQQKVFPGQKNEHDGRVGVKTLEKMDALLPKAGGGGPPAPPPPPVVGQAGVLVGPVGATGVKLINDYYNFCGLETIGPGQVTTSPARSFTTFEDLIDKLLAAAQFHQVVVCHGDGDDGLLVPLTAGTSFKKTGNVIGDLSGLADLEQQGKTDPKDPLVKVLLDGVVTDAKVARPTAQRIVHKLVLLRQKQFVLHFRACNMDDSVLVGKYKKALGARLITFHGCRLLFLQIAPEQFTPGNQASDFKNFANTAGKRIRLFEDPFGEISSMAIEVDDIDGHTNVKSIALMDRLSSADVVAWAEVIVRRWNNPAAKEFVIPVMWENTERTYHLPLEDGWRLKLKFV